MSIKDKNVFVFQNKINEKFDLPGCCLLLQGHSLILVPNQTNL